MEQILRRVRFFLGSNTKKGFYPLFAQLLDPEPGMRLFILKGGPGTGKSTLIKRVGARLAARSDVLEWIPCASDPHSFDALIDRQAGVAIVDGTAPHMLDPRYPGVCETMIHLGDAWDETRLADRYDEILPICAQIADCHARATASIRSAASLLDSNRAVAARCVDDAAVDRAVRSILPDAVGVRRGRETQRLLSAVSVGKVVFYDETIDALCPRVIGIPDEWGAASSLLLARLKEAALASGHSLIACPCSISAGEKLDHVLLPSLGLAVTAQNDYHRAAVDETLSGLTRPLPASADACYMRASAQRAAELIEQAGGQIERAKRLHDVLESFYVEAMDFAKLEPVYARILAAAGIG